MAYGNLLVYGICFMLFATAIGLLLAIVIDQKVRAENLLRTIYLYPMALSFVVTGTVWAWLLNPGIGIQSFVRGLGWSGFRFDWLVDRDMAIYTVVIAAVWQASGFAMALFLAGLRSLDADLYKAAQIDGASPDADVPADHGAGDVADRHRGARDPAAIRDQDLRARAGAHRRRSRHRHDACRPSWSTTTCSSAD